MGFESLELLQKAFPLNEGFSFLIFWIPLKPTALPQVCLLLARREDVWTALAQAALQETMDAPVKVNVFDKHYLTEPSLQLSRQVRLTEKRSLRHREPRSLPKDTQQGRGRA